MCIAVRTFCACKTRNLAIVLRSTWPGADTVGSVWRERTVCLPRARAKRGFWLWTRNKKVDLMSKAKKYVEQTELKS